MVLSAIVVTLIISDRHVSSTSSRTHVPRLCCFYWDDLRRTSTSSQVVDIIILKGGLDDLPFFVYNW